MIDKSGEICDSAEERTDVMEIGVKLKEARIKSGLTQENVAEKFRSPARQFQTGKMKNLFRIL